MASSMLLPPPLSLPQYALKARETFRLKDQVTSFENVRFGYFGEIGSLLASVKKSGRECLDATQSEIAAEELGDALWYLVSTAHQLEITADDLGESCLLHLRRHFGENEAHAVRPVCFRHIDGLIDAHRVDGFINRSRQLGSLANSAGVLANMTDVQLRALSAPAKRNHFGNLLTELVLTCASFNLHIEDVAHANLDKIGSRWPGDQPKYTAFFDEDSDYPEYEQLPRILRIEFIERGGYVVQCMNGVYIGDRLTDNSNEPDDYRFHDVFHLAYMAYLGWSPVMRALLKRKRKSKPSIDENEDGARAIIIEEGIATWIFNHAKQRDFYLGVEQGKLDYGILKQIQSMIHGYEVDKCKLWQWELAILKGFEVFRELRRHRGGIVVVDMDLRSISFEMHVQEAG